MFHARKKISAAKREDMHHWLSRYNTTMTEPSVWLRDIVEALRREFAHMAARPLSTYRLQLDREAMTYRHTAEVVPYLRELGISHLYTSPDRKARAGSPHGYAIVDYDALNPELGSTEDYQALVEALRSCGLGRIPDIVPNHMSAAAGENPWWTDVLENGPGSPYAAYFDIDWDPVKEELHNRILLPMLGQQYGDALESGQLRVEYRDGAFAVRVYDALLPLDPKTYPRVLARNLDRLKQALPADSPDVPELESILTALDHLPDRTQQGVETVRERQREKEVVKKRLGQLTAQCPAVAEFIASNLQEINGAAGNVESFDALHRLLDAQVYRLAHWKSAGDEINYRRFFDINDLAAICMEDPCVFENSHRPVFEMLLRGELSGLRIDHIDGLLDPTDYLWKLQRGWIRALGQKVLAELAEPRRVGQDRGASAGPPIPPDGGPALASSLVPPYDHMPSWSDLEPAVFQAIFNEGDHRSLPLYVVVEKILGPDEPLPRQWPVAGTTGYDYLRWVNGLFVDWQGKGALAKTFARFVGEAADFREMVHESKVSILRSAMSSELQLLARRLNRLSERHRRFRDFTLNMLRFALREMIVCFAVYRTYLRPQEISERDRRVIARAAAQAKRRNPDLDPGTFDFVRDVLLFEQPAPLELDGCRERELFVGRFQQVTSPVMAKGVEDTAFYRYFPLSSLNEVGDDPAGRPVYVDDFHRENAARQAEWPGSLLATTTHDTKRSEDTRARIDVLSEIAQEWGRAVNRWARINRRHRREVDGSPAPSRADEYLFYQSLLGIWPLQSPDEAAQRQIAARLQAYMEKATREAKLQTSWLNPNAGYDAAVREFVAAVLEPGAKNRFLARFTAFHAEIARFGLFNALAQVLLKLTSPGVPDIYQGQELWDFSLVDPDNRRSVDFDLRGRLLSELQREAARGPARRALARRLARQPEDQRLKLFVTWQTLQFRRGHAELFRDGQYTPLAVTGARADHVCAYARRIEAGNGSAPASVIVVVPRLLARMARAMRHRAGRRFVPLGASVWQDTRIALPAPAASALTNLYTGQVFQSNGNGIAVADVFREFPVALLTDG
jgi:(1->4)-alpha-D-glucan 1-alpha-D-glucosylmutase